jgi:Ca2+-binding RTX toxin-like protein/uncharacterized protein YdeI (BOF family)
MAAIRLEAENMTLNSGYVVKDRGFADNNQLIHLTELTGKATAAFNGTEGTYDVVLKHYDESDGEGTVRLTIGNNERRIDLDQDLVGSRPSVNNQVQTTVFSGLQINPGDNIEIRGAMDKGEVAAVDWIELIPVIISNPDITPPIATLTANNFNTNLNSTDTYTFEVKFEDNEAVNISNLNNAITVQDNNGVNQTVEFVGVDIESNGTPRVATYQLNAPGGSWDTNEEGNYTVSVVGNTVIDTSGNALVGGNLGSFEVDVQPDVSGETKSYAQSNQAVLVRLNQDFAIQLEYGRSFSFMPLGDSITAGQEKDKSLQPEEEREGYRRFLYEDLKEIGLDVDFVGSQSNGKDGFEDKDHEGYPGWNINQIALGRNGQGGVGEWLPAEDPDIVLLVIGTNDTGGENNASRMLNNLDTRLVNRIFDNLSEDSELILSSIPPVSPGTNKYQIRTDNIAGYNSGLPGIVEKYNDAGENISFVDIYNTQATDIEGNLIAPMTEDDMTGTDDDNGLHPAATGYEKMAKFYFNAVLDAAGTREDLINISNIVGSDFDDVIFGNDSPNEILGGEGDDELTGGGGADTFIYTKLADGEDILTDFNPAEGDTFQINADGFVGSGLTANTPLSDGIASATGVFVSGENPQAVGNSANILYNESTGILSMDLDGVGIQNPFVLATLEGAPVLGVNQFEIA